MTLNTAFARSEVMCVDAIDVSNNKMVFSIDGRVFEFASGNAEATLNTNFRCVCNLH